ncbi:MAG TPA: substrate-binding domain-containing protein [Devosia sp.]|jgi:LacI family transcriptional regulator|nr:substrate-binding domain-containing protein [Devosia sp.]
MNLKELASNLGLSQTTVSRALNGYPEVNEATRRRVAEAAARLGYRPNASARRLATGRAGAVGIVYSTNEGYGPHTSEFLGGLGARLANDEIDVLVSTVESFDDELATYRRAIASKKVDAIVVHSPRPNDARARLLAELDFPFIVHGRTEIATPAAWLDIDNVAATRRATEQLIQLGHRDIALLNGPKGLTFAIDREAGYLQAFASAGLVANTALMANGLFTDETGFRLAQAMLERKPRPTAFLAGSMMTALGVFRAIRSAGMTLGKDVSMIAHDDVFPYLNADTMVPKMSTTRSSIRAAGTRIAELLTQILAGKPAAEIHELWPVELVLRESTGPKL